MAARFVIGLMVFLATTFAYMLSFNFSINMLAMVQSAEAMTLNATMAGGNNVDSVDDDDDNVQRQSLPDVSVSCMELML